ncbi:DUF2339 domain-containing protein [Halalkalibacterium halodurans]|uniref:DUF2339 domain-containing protein n=1 Tax=Halalkalibacterium halodurans TaxID=86665 RepID=UPI002AA9F331|nr:DUF2339 domain-containing protein [Halalkalibacterium halodurans]MDY7224202.1 DUF2339 domain-containing protein [Halalkalibacterium halodurans]MDY7243487.1 DUF2339 domain-containing protein [Halalkalibacterium halodurans]
MNPMKEQLQRIKEEQIQLTKQYEKLVKDYESQDFIQENTQLRKDFEQYKKEAEQLKKNQQMLLKENQKLRFALKEQMLDERLALVKRSKQKIEIYFQQAPEQNRLKQLEQDAERKINALKDRAAKNLAEQKQEIMAKLHEMSLTLNDAIKGERERLAEEQRNLLKHISEDYTELENEELSEEVIQKRAKQNQMEMKIGLNWINKLGILLIILGVAAAFRYSYSNWFTDEVKGAAFFGLGLLMLVGGEWLQRKNKQTFALGVIGGGISVLYGSIFFSYFLLEIIGLSIALLLSVLVTICAVVLSLRYHSRTIISFGLVGGYIPFYSYLFAFGLEGNAVYAAMVYLLILNSSILWISFQKQWNIVHYISFAFALPSLYILLLLSPNDVVSLVYTVLTFALYVGLTIGYAFTFKLGLKWPDVSLLALNTFFSCLFMYYLFDRLEWNDLQGGLAVAFCFLYFGLGRFVERKIPAEKQTKVLFYGTSITFLVLTIPFQFGVEWLAFGWLVEAVVLMLYANRAKLKLLEKAGWGIFVLTLTTFSFEWFITMFNVSMSPYFHFKYTAVLIGLLTTTVYYAIEQRKEGSSYIFSWFKDLPLYLKYVTLLALWWYVIYESQYWYDQWVPDTFTNSSFYKGLLIAFLHIGLAYVVKKISLLYDRIVSYYCLALYAIGSLVGLILTFTMPTLEETMAQNTFAHYLALLLLIGFNLLIFFSGRDLLLAYIKQQYKDIELYPTILGVYLLGILAAFLTVQFRLADVGFVFSSVFLIVAVGYILYGFKKQYVYIRRIGLGLSLLSTGKLFLFDLTFLTETSKILAYFCFGVVLLGISYLYQKVSSKEQPSDQEHSL